MNIMIIDITSIFWEICKNIAILEYKELQKTESFINLIDHIENKDEFFIRIENVNLHFYDISDLFYGVFNFCKLYNIKEYCELLQIVIQKMENFIKIEEIDNIFKNFNI